ncbi:TPA_asm: P overlapped [Cynara alphacytorhabdovirus 1]|nr:TPA_asm: P overlapped [Cynara alphacytorhabdovirus 1]
MQVMPRSDIESLSTRFNKTNDDSHMFISELISVTLVITRLITHFLQQLWQRNHPLLTLVMVWLLAMLFYQIVILMTTMVRMIIHIIRFLMLLFKMMKRLMTVIWWTTLELRKLSKRLVKTLVSLLHRRWRTM